MRIAASIVLAFTLLGCDDSRDEPEPTTATTVSPSTTVPETTDESSSSDGGSSSSGDAPWEPQPYGPCEYDAACHCDDDTCVAPCSVDTDCPGSNARCLDDGCYLQCFGAASCAAVFPDPAPNGQTFQCRAHSIETELQVCQWD